MVTIRFPSSSGTSTSVGTAAGAAGSIPSVPPASDRVLHPASHKGYHDDDDDQFIKA